MLIIIVSLIRLSYNYGFQSGKVICHWAESTMQADEAFTLLDLVIATIGVILTMAMLTCLCCLFMKISDLKLKCYIIETAKKKGIDLDIDKLDSRASSTLKDETCAIMVPDICVITV